jgi:hypothetical protein
MIIRISSEGQYDLGEGDIAALNELDNAAVAAVNAEDEQQFQEIFARLLDFIRTNGRAVGDEDLVGSDLILPPPDVTMDEARADFSGEGLLPG